jgi:carnosine N-methyltransferase
VDGNRNGTARSTLCKSWQSFVSPVVSTQLECSLLAVVHNGISNLCRPKGLLKQKAEATRAAVHYNQHFFTKIASSQREELGLSLPQAGSASATPAAATASSTLAAPSTAASTGEDGGNEDTPACPLPTSDFPMGSSPAFFQCVKAILRQLVREWSSEGMLERELCYGPLLAELAAHMPVTTANRNTQRVLIPGCGLGRLPLEIAARGYAAHGNDASYFMLFCSAYIMNKVTKPNSMQVYPWVHETSNHFRPADMLRPVSLPDVAPADMLSVDPTLQITMSSGAFLDTYGGEEHDGKWDSVATSFFLDTAPVALEYMLAIYRLLRPGGVWVNLGPLQYQWATRMSPPAAKEGTEGPWPLLSGLNSSLSEGYERSVELSYLELRHACVAAGFQFLSEATRTCTYGADLNGMAKTVYSAVLFTVRKPEGCVPAESLLPGAAERQGSSGDSVGSSATAAGADLEGTGPERMSRLNISRVVVDGMVGSAGYAGGRATPASDGGAGGGTDTESALGALAEAASATAALQQQPAVDGPDEDCDMVL